MARRISIGERVVSAIDIMLRVIELAYYKALLTAVDRITRLPRTSTMPEAMRLYRENIALKAQIYVLEAELDRRTQPAPLPMAARAAQVFALCPPRIRSLSHERVKATCASPSLIAACAEPAYVRLASLQASWSAGNAGHARAEVYATNPRDGSP
ncbi:hypothetical protein [Stigmatella aurantiaca]|nr:hypothetical protein [Stigmatella aurantiaca]ADO70244.1 uncharacterized protein STAUR_2440 [Stigmatella aurantiaca DW4/3-1]